MLGGICVDAGKGLAEMSVMSFYPCMCAMEHHLGGDKEKRALLSHFLGSSIWIRKWRIHSEGKHDKRGTLVSGLHDVYRC